jgi:hypothetical protein
MGRGLGDQFNLEGETRWSLIGRASNLTSPAARKGGGAFSALNESVS